MTSTISQRMNVIVCCFSYPLWIMTSFLRQRDSFQASGFTAHNLLCSVGSTPKGAGHKCRKYCNVLNRVCIPMAAFEFATQVLEPPVVKPCSERTWCRGYKLSRTGSYPLRRMHQWQVLRLRSFLCSTPTLKCSGDGQDRSTPTQRCR